MKPSPSARDLALDVLLGEARGHGFVRDLLPAARARAASPRERALVTELAYGVVRRRATLDRILAASSARGLDRVDRAVLQALRLALYQVVFLDRVPAYAAVDHAVGWVRHRVGARAAGFVNGVLRAATRAGTGLATGPEDPRRDVPREDGSAVRLDAPLFPDPSFDLAENLALRYACPRWLVERWLARLGLPRTRSVLGAGIGTPPLALRARRDPEKLLHALVAEGVPARPGPVANAVLVEAGGEAKALRHVGNGEAWVQDATAQRVAPLLDPTREGRWLDLCAAPGGKTLHLADLLPGRGTIVACDVDERKLARLERVRAYVPEGVRLETRIVPADGPLPFDRASFDGVLVDAPCTNTGVLRRRVEARWRLAPEDVLALARVQRALLDRAWPLVRPGGRLVYATCSLEPEENQETVASLTEAQPDATLLRSLEVPPGRDQDGGFAAVLVRGG